MDGWMAALPLGDARSSIAHAEAPRPPSPGLQVYGSSALRPSPCAKVERSDKGGCFSRGLLRSDERLCMAINTAGWLSARGVWLGGAVIPALLSSLRLDVGLTVGKLRLGNGAR